MSEYSYCPNCGEQLPGQVQFCPSCGEDIGKFVSDSQSTSDGSLESTNEAKGTDNDIAPEPESEDVTATMEQEFQQDRPKSTDDNRGDISKVAMIFGFGASLSLLLSIPLKYGERCIQTSTETTTFGSFTRCVEYESIYFGDYGVIALIFGMFIGLFTYSEYKKMNILGSWRLKKANWFALLGLLIFGSLALTEDMTQNGSGTVLLAIAPLGLLLYAVPTKIWQLMFEKEEGKK